MNRRRLKIVGAVLTLFVATLLRIDSASTRSIRFDEAWSWVVVSQASFSDVIDAACRDFNPPFYWILLRFWVSIVGETEFAIRSLSVVAGLISVVLVYALTHEVTMYGKQTAEVGSTSNWCGLYASAMLAVSSVHIVWSQQARMYALATAMTIASCWMFLRALRRNESRCWVGYTATASLLTWTHNFGAFVILSQFVFVVGEWRRHTSKVSFDSCPNRPPFRQAVTCICVVGCLFVPWIWMGAAAQYKRVLDDYWIPESTCWSSFEVVWHNCFPAASLVPPSNWLLIVWFDAVVLLSLLRHSPGVKLALLLFWIPHIAAMVISLTSTPLMFARYFQFGHVGLVVALSCWLGSIKPQLIQKSVAIGVVLGSVVWHLQLRKTIDPVSRPGVKAICHYLRSQHPQLSRVLVTSSYHLHACRYYLPEYEVKLYVVDEVPQYIGGSILTADDQVSRAPMKPYLRVDRGVVGEFSAKQVWIWQHFGDSETICCEIVE